MKRPVLAIRVNVSIPSDLKEEMDKADESVNWSKVAADAFRCKLLELEATKKATKLEDVVARMKVAAQLDENQEYQQGYREGERWAKDDARPRQLSRLKDEIENSDGYGAGDACTAVRIWGSKHNQGVAYGLASTIAGQEPSDGEELNGFWENAIGDQADRIEDADFARGFIEGALKVWGHVESLV